MEPHEESLVERLRKRAAIRREYLRNGDRIADLLEEAADEIESLLTQAENQYYMLEDYE